MWFLNSVKEEKQPYWNSYEISEYLVTGRRDSELIVKL